MKRWQGWAVAVALLAAAWGVALVTPGEAQEEAPFVVPMQIGETATGRDLQITVRDVLAADGVRTESGSRAWSAEGDWLVLHLDAAFVNARDTYLLSRVVAVIDGITYRASERPASLAGAPLDAAIPLSGSVAFELPDHVWESEAVVQFAGDDDTRLDSLLELRIDLADVPRESDVLLEETRWPTP